VSEVIEEINFRNIGLSTNRAIKLIENLNKKKIKSLDLSLNPMISKEFYNVLAEYIDDPLTELQKLQLEGNKIGDFNIQKLCSKIEENIKITYLNFSNNDITNIGAGFLCKMLDKNEKINVLFLHWNRIYIKGGI